MVLIQKPEYFLTSGMASGILEILLERSFTRDSTDPMLNFLQGVLTGVSLVCNMTYLINIFSKRKKKLSTYSRSIYRTSPSRWNIIKNNHGNPNI